jgi:pimeloyl-ACP methyl ester carboxylesterase
MTSNATVLAQRIPGAEKHLIAKARHAYFRDHRAESSQVVKDFLLRHPLPPSEPAPAQP